MGIAIPKHRLHYTPVPKAACSSIKSLLYFIENGEFFRNSVRSGRVFHIHNYYHTRPFSPMPPAQQARFWKFAVVRDPVRRLLSCYSNRVRHYNELSEKHISAESIASGATPNPSLEEFVEKLELYMRASESIRHHAMPQAHFLGDSAAYYDRIFQMNELKDLEQELGDRVGTPLTLPHEQIGGIRISISDLSASAIDKIRQFYARDYDVFRFPGA